MLLLGIATPFVVPERAAAAHPLPPAPDSMAALGDSITRAFDSCGWWQDCPARSWATGDDAVVNSQYLRIRTKNPAIDGRAYNDAKSGAKVANLDRQAQTAISRRVDYVTILIGANDACTPSESTMTPVSTFETGFRTAVGSLRQGLPDVYLLVLSIPDVKRLWAVGRNSLAARKVWHSARICQSMLVRPASTAPADNARRERVRQRVVDFNQVLAAVCASDDRCRFDGNAVFSYPFTLNQVSAWDYFHPNRSGQAVLAELSYQTGYSW